MRCRARLGDQVDEAEQVLVRVAEPHPAPDPRLVEAGGAREVEGRHALVLVPGVDHPPDARVGAVDLEPRQEAVPHLVQRMEGVVDRARLRVLLEEAATLLLVHDARPLELRLVALVDVGQHEREGLLGAGLEAQVELVRADRVPAVRDAPLRGARERDARLVEAVVDADEGVARGVEAGRLARAREERVVAASLAELGGVVDRRALDLHLADRPGALEVRHVVQRLVEAELDVRVELQLLRRRARVADRRLPELGRLARGHEEELLDLDAVARAEEPRVAEPVAALVAVERGLRRLPARVPDRAAVVDVEVAAAEVERHVVVPVARQAPQLGVAPEGEAAGGVRAEADQLVLAQVVQPRQRRVRAMDHVLAPGVVELAVRVHRRCPAMKSRYQWKLDFGTRSSVG